MTTAAEALDQLEARAVNAIKALGERGVFFSREAADDASALERINLRLTPEVLKAIDAECSRRAGSVSRNTWITEAVTERLGRLASSSHPQGAGGANG